MSVSKCECIHSILGDATDKWQCHICSLFQIFALGTLCDSIKDCECTLPTTVTLQLPLVWVDFEVRQPCHQISEALDRNKKNTAIARIFRLFHCNPKRRLFHCFSTCWAPRQTVNKRLGSLGCKTKRKILCFGYLRQDNSVMKSRALVVLFAGVTHLLETPPRLVEATTVECRDRYRWPFASTSIWNTPIGSNATFKAANLFSTDPSIDLVYPLPTNFFGDIDFIYVVTETDPLTLW